MRWQEEGEKSSKFFLSTEEFRGKSKIITELKNREGKSVKNIEDILDTAKGFYEDLYTSEETDSEIQDKFLETIDKKLTEVDKLSCDGIISEEEVLEAIKSFKNNVSPGEDGFQKEFYITFWDMIGESLTEVINICHERGQMTDSMNKAVMTLLY